MYSFLPAFRMFGSDPGAIDLPRVFAFHHSTAHDTGYISQGICRREDSHCIFHYTVRGHGKVWYQGREYRTSPGEGFLGIINDETSGYGYPDGETEPWEFVVLCFRGGNTREIVADCLSQKCIYSMKGFEDPFYMLLKRLDEEISDEIQYTAFPKLMTMLKNRKNGCSAITERFRAIAGKEYMNNPTLSGIAAEMNLSREHLTRVYSAETGNTPGRYLDKLRFETLCDLLSTGLSEDKIVAMMHFTGTESMTAFFRKHSGITPRQYRKNGYICT